MDTVYTALYDYYSKIAFAAPEGFNCSVSFTEQDLTESFELSQMMRKSGFGQNLNCKSVCCLTVELT
ncbi:hypothetical protein OH492_14160 [Vibrio chagasii]|nr:hypothetical protein [Vibrio chagasii]